MEEVGGGEGRENRGGKALYAGKAWKAPTCLPPHGHYYHYPIVTRFFSILKREEFVSNASPSLSCVTRSLLYCWKN